MKRLIVAAALVAASSAMAGDLVMSNKDGNELRLYDRACSHGGTLAILKEEWRPNFHDARIRDKRGTIVWYACWIEENGQAVVVFEDGDVLAFPLSAFQDPNV